tara:strand:+ start:207 stop:3152 length:2946 start_codon:yes stop_codon:yes gene_type:complete
MVGWPGASAADVAGRILQPLEQVFAELRQLDNMKGLAVPGRAVVTLRFALSRDLRAAYDEVDRILRAVRVLPGDSTTPQLEMPQFMDPVTTVLLEGVGDREELRDPAFVAADAIQALGAAKVYVGGLPKAQIRVDIPAASLWQYGINYNDLISSIQQSNTALPGGDVGWRDKPTVLRSSALANSLYRLRHVALATQPPRELGMIAKVHYLSDPEGVFWERKGHPVVPLVVYRASDGDSVSLARQVSVWLQAQPQVEALRWSTFRETWTFVSSRMQLLLRNAVSGLVLLLVVLGLVLGPQLAFWVAFGIPLAILVTLFVLYVGGRSLNVISSFAFILGLGIIVDDAIVVAEQAASNQEKGLSPPVAAAQAARQMLRPVCSSSLTTIASMFPLFFVRGVWADFLLDIPVVIVAVIVASLLECFLLLPAHLSHATIAPTSAWRKRYFGMLSDCCNRYLVWLLHAVIAKPYAIAMSVFAIVLLSGAVLHSGNLAFVFYPKTDSDEMVANVTFVPGTSLAQRRLSMQRLEESVWQVNAGYPRPVIRQAIVQYHAHEHQRTQDRLRSVSPAQYASLLIELSSRDTRVLGNADLLAQWRLLWPRDTHIASINVRSVDGGPRGDDFSVRLQGTSLSRLKEASLALQNRLQRYSSVIQVSDDLPYGQEHLEYSLRPGSLSMGLTKSSIARQLQELLHGRVVAHWYRPYQVLDVRVGIAENDRDHAIDAPVLPIQLPQGGVVPLASLVDFQRVRGFDTIVHDQGRPTITVDAQLSSREQIASLWQEAKEIARDYSVTYRHSAAMERQQATLRDMAWGGLVGSVLIYTILVAILGSFLLPCAIVAMVPLGLVGAIWGHWLLGLPLGLFSLFGFFTLSGIVINDGIILVLRFQSLWRLMPMEKALVMATQQRLRAILLTSLSTIVGLLPILLDQSATARYFHTTVVTIICGLGGATLLLIFVLPCGVAAFIRMQRWWLRTCSRYTENGYFIGS